MTYVNHIRRRQRLRRHRRILNVLLLAMLVASVYVIAFSG
jgi:hypothetical protein